MDYLYHLSSPVNRESIERAGLVPGWGGGCSTGLSPWAGSGAPLKGIYLSCFPGLIGLKGQASFEGLTGDFDIWECKVERSKLLPDFPALIEFGAVVEADGFWFEDDDSHERLGGLERHTIQAALANPMSYFMLTGTAMSTEPIPPTYLRLRSLKEFGLNRKLPYEDFPW